jgi:hypothetical protein
VLVGPVRWRHLLRPVFEQEIQLAKHLRDVRAVDLVDDQDEFKGRAGSRQFSDAPQGTLRCEERRSVLEGGRDEPLDDGIQKCQFGLF